MTAISNRLGHIGMALGAIALFTVVFHFFAGPFAPRQTVDVTVGQLAWDITKSAARAAAGVEQPAPVPAPWDIDRVIDAAAAGFGALAIILGFVAFVQKQSRPAVIGSIALGGTAIVFQFFAFYAMAVLGVLLIWAILDSLGLNQMFDGFGS